MDKFVSGEKVYAPKIGVFVEIERAANYHTPTLYECVCRSNNKGYAFYEHELMSVWEHDKKFGLIP